MTSEKYHDLYSEYDSLDTAELQRVIATLHEKRFREYDLEAQAEHRIAVRVLLDRNKTGDEIIRIGREFYW